MLDYFVKNIIQKETAHYFIKANSEWQFKKRKRLEDSAPNNKIDKEERLVQTRIFDFILLIAYPIFNKNSTFTFIMYRWRDIQNYEFCSKENGYWHMLKCSRFEKYIYAKYLYRFVTLENSYLLQLQDTIAHVQKYFSIICMVLNCQLKHKLQVFYSSAYALTYTSHVTNFCRYTIWQFLTCRCFCLC